MKKKFKRAENLLNKQIRYNWVKTNGNEIKNNVK